MNRCVFFHQSLCLDHDQVLLPNRSASRAYKSMPSSHQSVFQARDSSIPLAWPMSTCATTIRELQIETTTQNASAVRTLADKMSLQRTFGMESVAHPQQHTQSRTGQRNFPRTPQAQSCFNYQDSWGNANSRGSHGYDLASPQMRDRKCLFPLGDEYTPAEKNFFPACCYESRVSI